MLSRITSFFGVMAMAALMLGASCKKSSDEPGVSARTQLISSKNWKWSDVTRTQSGSTTSIFSTFQACVKDNIYSFQANGAYSASEGASKCATTDPDIVEQGNWQFLNNENDLKVTSGPFEISYVITELTASGMKLAVTDNSGGITKVFTYIYSAQ
jgi:Lipocalin-like domain